MELADGARHAAGRPPRPGTGRVRRPALYERLSAAGRVTVISAPAGSGKTVLAKEWADQAGGADRVAWTAVGPDGRDPQRFWLSVLDALRATVAGATLVRALTATPDLDGWEVVERLLTDLAPLTDRIWLVIDDVHELGPAEARRQLELLVMRASAELRFVLVTRHDVRLGLHRLRLDGELTELVTADLRFTPEEARHLLAAAGVTLPEPSLALLHGRTEGWAAGLRLAALSLAGHRDPERFVAEFSGSERTVAEYLLAEVLERQPGPVRELLLRTSVLEWVSGELADALTGGSGAEGVLQDLERANAFVFCLDASRSRFRYHRLFADLLRLELRRTAPDQLAALHRTAAGWLAGHGHPVDAIRHAQAAGEWRLATRLLADHWAALYLDGRTATTHELLTGFPDEAAAADGELAALFAADELAHGSVTAAQRYLGLAERREPEAPADRHDHLRLLLGIVRLMLARRRGDLPAAAEQARQVQRLTEAEAGAGARRAGAADATRPRLEEDLRALALTSLDSSEYWTASFAEARRHLKLGRVLARRTGRPYLEFSSLAYQAANEFFLSFDLAADHGMRAVNLARQHGWTEEPAAGAAYMTLGAVRAWQGRLDESEQWVRRAEHTIRAAAQPLAGMGICHVRATLASARGRNTEALAAFEAAEQLSGLLAAPNPVATSMHGFQLQTLVRLGETERAARVLNGLDRGDREKAEMRIVLAMLRLAQDDPHAAVTALAPVLDGSATLIWRAWSAQAFLLEAIARDRLEDPAAAERALERALDLAEPDGVLIWFLLHPAHHLLSRHHAHRTRHAALITAIRNLSAGSGPADTWTAPPLEPLSHSEMRVLRYLPTHLPAPEIARELSVSRNTVKTHLRNVYRKLGAHGRAEAVARARALGLLAPFARPL
ncbi:LuxR C-terminal-related transcriptional regulator [Streptomyces sp. NPDC050617]|uniref:LuxR C-terminal-related transcriptional regulator n=1 Tax=Streptomyces sp. NPDC050617 TaxID=3154628 RepID=UPI0034496CB0